MGVLTTSLGIATISRMEEQDPSRSIEPTLKISLGGTAAAAFALEEFTINPFFAPNEGSQHPACNLWIEFLIRSDSKATVPVPQLPIVEIQLRDLKSASVEPVTEFTEGAGLPPIDINKLCYGEIWASFIPSADGRGDFMKTGYRRSARKIGKKIDFTDIANHLEEGSLPQTDSSFRRAAEDLRNRLILFQEVFSETSDSCIGPAPVPRGLGYSGTQIEVDATIPRGALAFVRRPWGASDDREAGTTFPCAALAERAGLKWTIKPSPILAEGESLGFALAPGQRLAFWVLVRDVWCTRADPLRTAFTFQLDVVSGVPIEHFNVFFRMSPAYQFREGALTDLKRYAAPPRLFSLWDSYSQSECYSHHAHGIGAETPLKINADFLFAKLDFQKLTSLFLLSLVINLLASIAINLLTAISVGAGEELPRRLKIAELGVDWPVALVLSQTVATMILLLAVIQRVYSNRLNNLRFVTVCALIIGALSGPLIQWLLLM